MSVAKRLLAALLAVTLVIGLVPVSAKAAADDGSIKLGNATWDEAKTSYKFPSAEVNYPVGKVQFIFALTVDNGGSFTIPTDTVKTFITGKNTKVFGIRYNVSGNENKYVDEKSLKDGDKLSSITVTTDVGVTEANVAWLLRNIWFHRNDAVTNNLPQVVNVATSGAQLEDNMSAMMGTDGKFHYYKYVTYESLNRDKPYDWYTAYAEAKKSTFNGLKGYLATVTDELEQELLFESLGGKTVNLRAWIGGARTLTPSEGAKFTFDCDAFSDKDSERLIPVKDGEPVQNWYWMCGPEANHQFFARASMNNQDTQDGKVNNQYTGWNRMTSSELGEQYQNSYEPNNYAHNGTGWNEPYNDPYASQEYVLEFGFYKANWNDFNPHEPNINNNFGTNGYIVEYSEYGSNVPTTPVTSDEKQIVNPNTLIAAKDFVVKKGTYPDGDQGYEDFVKPTYADVKVDSTANISYNITDFQKAAANVPKNDDLGDYKIVVSATGAGSSSSSSTTVTATVTDEAATKDNKSIGANNFEMSLDQAKAYVSGKPNSDEMLKKLAHATAIDNGIKESDLSKILIVSTTIKPAVTDSTNPPYDVTFQYGEGGPSVTVKVTVKDDGVPINGDVTDVPGINLTANDVKLYANDSDVMAIKDNMDAICKLILKESEAHANRLDGMPITNIIIKDTDKNKAALNEIQEALTIPNKTNCMLTLQAIDTNGDTVETEILVAVVTYPLIEASDFIVGKNEDIANIIESNVIGYAEAARYENKGDETNGVGPNGKVGLTDEELDDLKTAIKNGPGKDTVAFVDKTSGSGSKAEPTEVTATIVDDAGRNMTEHIAIGANNFEMSKEQAKAYNDGKAGTKDMLKILANAIATDDGKSVPISSIGIDTVTIDPNVTTEQEVTFTYTKPAAETTSKKDETVKATVKVKVRDDGAPEEGLNPYRPDPSNLPDVNLTADDVKLSLGEIEKSTLPTDVKTESKPKAKDSDGSQISSDNIKVVTDDPQYASLQKAVDNNQPGKYPVNLQTTGKSGTPATTEITVTLTGVDANDFIVGLDELPNLKDDDIKKAADAGISDGTNKDLDKPINVVDWDKLKAATEPGKIDDAVTFLEKEGDKNPKAVDVTVVDNSKADPAKAIKLGANNIVLTEAEAKNLKGTTVKVTDTLKDMMGAVATDKGKKVSTININVIDNKIEPKYSAEGYPVTFEYKGVEVIAYAKVVKDSDITAKDFGVDGGSPELTPDDFKKKAEVVSTDETGADVTDKAKVDPDDLKKLNDAIKNNVPGEYPVKVSTPDGKKTETVKVTVKDPVSTTPNPGDTIGDDRVYEISNPQDIPQDLDPGRTVDRVTIDGVPIKKDDYVVDGNKIAIKPTAMTDKKASDTPYPVAIIYADGTKRTFNVKVLDYDPATVVPLKKVPIFNMQKDIGVGKKFKLNLVGMNANAYIDSKNTKTSNKKIATIDPKTLVIKARKKGKCNIQAAIIQNGSYYSVKIKLVVKKKMTMYNLKNAALVKKQGTLPEFNVYKRVVKGKKTKLKFTQVAKNAKITYTSSNKKVATISKKGVITGKKKGFAKITAKIEQEGHVYYTRLFVRVDDGTKNKQLKKYLTTKVK